MFCLSVEFSGPGATSYQERLGSQQGMGLWVTLLSNVAARKLVWSLGFRSFFAELNCSTPVVFFALPLLPLVVLQVVLDLRLRSPWLSKTSVKWVSPSHFATSLLMVPKRIVAEVTIVTGC